MPAKEKVCFGGYELGAAMIKVGKKTDGGYSVEELFRHNDFGDHTKPPILYNGYFYAQFSTNSKRDGLCCMSMDGKVMWKTMRSPLFDKGSMSFPTGLYWQLTAEKPCILYSRILQDSSLWLLLRCLERARTGALWRFLMASCFSGIKIG